MNHENKHERASGERIVASHLIFVTTKYIVEERNLRTLIKTDKSASVGLTFERVYRVEGTFLGDSIGSQQRTRHD